MKTVEETRNFAQTMELRVRRNAENTLEYDADSQLAAADAYMFVQNFIDGLLDKE